MVNINYLLFCFDKIFVVPKTYLISAMIIFLYIILILLAMTFRL